MQQENELSQIEHHTLSSSQVRIWQVMSDYLDRVLERDGFLPCGLYVRPCAKGIYDVLVAEQGTNLAPPNTINDWMSVYAMAVNQQNAPAVRSSPPLKIYAAGVLPSVLRYYLDYVPDATK